MRHESCLFQAETGQRCYEGTMPRIARALERIALAIGKIADAQEQASREGVEPSRKERAEPTKEVPQDEGDVSEKC